MTQGAGLEYSLQAALTLSKLRAREEINSHFAAGPQARWRGASDELYPGRYVRSEQQSQQGRSPKGRGGGRASALLPLLDDVRHRLRRGASHLPARRSRQNVNLFLREPLARGERFLRTPGTRAYVTNTPRQRRRRCVSLFLFYPGVSLRSPPAKLRLGSFRSAGAEFGTTETVPSRSR